MSADRSLDAHLRCLASISPRNWRHLLRHLPFLDTSLVPKLALVQSPLSKVLNASLTPEEWEFMTKEAESLSKLGSADDVPLGRFLADACKLAAWLADSGELSILTLESTQAGELALYSWATGEFPNLGEEIAFYESQCDAENPCRHLILGQSLLRQRQAGAKPHLERAMVVPLTRQRALYAMGMLYSEHLNEPIIDRTECQDPFSRLHDDRAAAFLWEYAAYREDPEEANNLGWQDEHLLMLDVLTPDELAVIDEVLESDSTPPGIVLADVELLFRDQDKTPPGVRTLDALRTDQKKRDPKWYRTRREIRAILNPVTEH